MIFQDYTVKTFSGYHKFLEDVQIDTLTIKSEYDKDRFLENRGKMMSIVYREDGSIKEYKFTKDFGGRRS